jgi:hypothetical protein
MISVLKNGAFLSRKRWELPKIEITEGEIATDGSKGMTSVEQELERRRRGLTGA